MNKGANPSINDNFGRSLLHKWNPQKGPDLETILKAVSLNNKGTNETASLTDFNMHTALHLAALDGNKQKVVELLKNNSDLFAQDKMGLTPLHFMTKHPSLFTVLQVEEGFIPPDLAFSVLEFAKFYGTEDALKDALKDLLRTNTAASSPGVRLKGKENLEKMKLYTDKNNSGRMVDIIFQKWQTMHSQNLDKEFILQNAHALLCCNRGPMLHEMRECVQKVLNEILVEVSNSISKLTLFLHLSQSSPAAVEREPRLYRLMKWMFFAYFRM